MTLKQLVRSVTGGRDKTDSDLDRLIKAADAGGQGVNLAEMSDEEFIRRLSVRPR